MNNKFLGVQGLSYEGKVCYSSRSFPCFPHSNLSHSLSGYLAIRKFVLKPSDPPSLGLSQFPCSINKPRVLLLPPGWDPCVPAFRQTSLAICQYPFLLLCGERNCKSLVSCQRTQHRDQARSQTQISQLRIQCTDRQATASLIQIIFQKFKTLHEPQDNIRHTMYCPEKACN